MTDETLTPDRDDPPYFDGTPPEKDPETEPKAPNDWPKVTPNRAPTPDALDPDA